MKIIHKLIALFIISFGATHSTAANETNLSGNNNNQQNPNPCSYCWAVKQLPKLNFYQVIVHVPEINGQLTLNPIIGIQNLLDKQIVGEQIEQLQTPNSGCSPTRGNVKPSIFILDDPQPKAQTYDVTDERIAALRRGYKRSYDVNLLVAVDSPHCAVVKRTVKFQINYYYQEKPKDRDNGNDNGNGNGGGGGGGNDNGNGNGGGGGGGNPGTGGGDPFPSDSGLPSDRDSDCDGLLDSIELAVGTNAWKADSDEDGLSDFYEITYNLNPLVKDQLYRDEDKDGLDLLQEFRYNTNPLLADTDSDGLPDLWEISQGINPTVADEGAYDAQRTGANYKIKYKYINDFSHSDSDGLPDFMEKYWKTDHNLADTDLDAINDFYEISNKLNPLKNIIGDYDKDGLSDLYEADYSVLGNTARFSPTDYDTDWDGLPDAWELGQNEGGSDYSPFTLMDNLIYWLRLDVQEYNRSTIYFNHAFNNVGAHKADAFVHGNVYDGYEGDVRKGVANFFAGNQGNIVIPDSNNLLQREDLTIGLFLKLYQNTCNPIQRIFFQEKCIDCVRLNDGKIRLVIRNHNGQNFTIETNTPLNFDIWHHLSITLSRSGANTECKVYINGINSASATIAGHIASGFLPFYLGSTITTPSLVPNGSFSDFRIYS